MPWCFGACLFMGSHFDLPARSRLATFYRCAARAVRQGLRAPPRRPSAGSLLGPPTRPLAPKFKGLMEVGARGVEEGFFPH